MRRRALSGRMKALALWGMTTALSVAAYFGYRCPAPGCPCCKLAGK